MTTQAAQVRPESVVMEGFGSEFTTEQVANGVRPHQQSDSEAEH